MRFILGVIPLELYISSENSCQLSAFGSLYFCDYLNLNSVIERDGQADGAAGMQTCLAKNFAQQIATAMNNAGRVIETRSDIYHAKDLDNTRHIVKAAGHGFYGLQAV
jgi:hypothetical protein